MMEVNGHVLNVEIDGPADGPVVVLLHHGLGSTRAWKSQIPVLARAGYRTIAYDRWGYGDSDPRPQLSMPYFEDDRQDLQVLLDRLEVGKANLVGHSDGGTLALYYAADRPERVSSLVVVAAHVYVEPKMGPGIDAVRQVYQADPRFQEGLRRVHGDKVEAVFWGWYHCWRRPENLSWDMRSTLRQITCPALVVQGLEDEHASPRHAEDTAAAIPSAHLWLVPGANHMLPQEWSEPFNQRLLAFLGKCEEVSCSGKS